MKKQAMNDDFDVVKQMLVNDYQEKQSKIEDYGSYANLCGTCDLLGHQSASTFLIVRLSDTIKQGYDKKFMNARYINYIEQYKFDFLADEFVGSDQTVMKILTDFVLVDSFDKEKEVIRYTSLKEDKSSPLYVFFELGKQA